MGQVILLTWHMKLAFSMYVFTFGGSSIKKITNICYRIVTFEKKTCALFLNYWCFFQKYLKVTILVLNFLERSFLALAVCLKRFRQPSGNY